jgi:ABC-2 type transport system ATP-binding protein
VSRIMPMIETINLTKRYGDLVALNNLNLVINEGDCFGFIGPNGAGKTTTIKILATLLKPSSGQANVAGLTVGYQNRQIRPLIGYVPDFMGAYEDMVVHGVPRVLRRRVQHPRHAAQEGRRRCPRTDRSDLQGDRRGEQPLPRHAAAALRRPRAAARPQGPADGRARLAAWTPRARIEMRELLKELKRMGKTILISSHILHELAELCNVVGIIERGQLLFAQSRQVHRGIAVAARPRATLARDVCGRHDR